MLDKYRDEPYVDTVVFGGKQAAIYHAAVGVFSARNYSLVEHDSTRGIVTGVVNSAELLAEDRFQMDEAAGKHKHGASGLEALVGIVLLVGLIAAVFTSGKSNDGDQSAEPDMQATGGEGKTCSYRYSITLSSKPVGMDSTEVEISTVRGYLEDGVEKSTTRLENKYLNYSIFDEIDEALKKAGE